MKTLQLFVVFCLIGWSKITLAADVPEMLFDITLGGVYHLGNRGADDIPKKKFAGIKQGFGNGIHYYFQPRSQYKHFPYVEKKTGAEDQYYETSFKLYLLPIITFDSKKSANIKDNKPQWEVLAIDWSNNVVLETEAYRWAMDLCQTYTKQITVQAEITDYPDSKWYECRFAFSDRVLNIGGMASRINISLSYSSEIIISKEESVKTKLLQLQTNSP